ncbi:MAG: TadE/TadG family type IV pilus assembly protein [Parvibaculales bacterium]
MPRLWFCKKGIAAVEFALIAPILLVIFLGLVDIVQLLRMNYRLARVAETGADITSRCMSVNNSYMAMIMDAARAGAAPINLRAVALTISVLEMQANNTKGKIVWSRKTGTGSGRMVGEELDILPTSTAISDGDHIVFAEAEYVYQGLLSSFFMGDVTLNETALFFPRFSDTISHNPAAPNPNCEGG